MGLGLPGDVVRSLDGSGACWFCNERPATKLVQGETDSFGAEYNEVCDECDRRCREEERAARNDATCDWCKKRNGPVGYARDVDEGMSGPVYLVCDGCREKQNENIARELEYYALD